MRDHEHDLNAQKVYQRIENQEVTDMLTKARMESTVILQAEMESYFILSYIFHIQLGERTCKNSFIVSGSIRYDCKKNMYSLVVSTSLTARIVLYCRMLSMVY